MSKNRMLLIALAISISGCTTTTTKLKTNTNNMQRWEVDGSIDSVFRKYKDYAEENMSGGDFLWSGGLRVKGYFYGPNAELSIKMEGNPLARITYLHFELEKEEEHTLVNVWYYNGPWERAGNKFKSLFDTKVIQGAP